MLFKKEFVMAQVPEPHTFELHSSDLGILLKAKYAFYDNSFELLYSTQISY